MIFIAGREGGERFRRIYTLSAGMLTETTRFDYLTRLDLFKPHILDFDNDGVSEIVDLYRRSRSITVYRRK